MTRVLSYTQPIPPTQHKETAVEVTREVFHYLASGCDRLFIPPTQHKKTAVEITQEEVFHYLASGCDRLLVMRGRLEEAPSWSRSFSSQIKLSPTSLSTDLNMIKLMVEETIR